MSCYKNLIKIFASHYQYSVFKVHWKVTVLHVRGIHNRFALVHHGYSSNTLTSVHTRARLHECIRPALSVRPGHSLHYFRGDGEIRTHDPLLARQVLSQLSYTPIQSWQPPALPHRLQCSTIGRPGLNHRVRDENGCDPRAHRHQECVR